MKTVEFSSKEDELNILIEESGSVFERYKERNPMPNVFIVEVEKATDIPQITKTLNNMEGIEKAQYGGESIQDMIDTFETIRYGGAVFILALGVLAIFLITNRNFHYAKRRGRKLVYQNTVHVRRYAHWNDRCIDSCDSDDIRLWLSL